MHAQVLSITATRPKRIKLMSHDDQRRDTPTEAAPPPTPHDVPTNPHSSSAPLIPKAGAVPRLSEHMRDVSIDTLIDLYREAKGMLRAVLDPDGELALAQDARSNRLKGELVAELSDAVDRIAGRPVRDLDRRVAGLADVTGKLKDDVEQLVPRVAGSESKIEALTKALQDTRAEFEQRISSLERQLKEANDAATGAAPTSPT